MLRRSRTTPPDLPLEHFVAALCRHREARRSTYTRHPVPSRLDRP